MTVTRGLLDLNGHKGLSSIVLTRHFGDLLAALIQLSHAPLKKPNNTAEHEAQKQKSPSPNGEEEFVMTEEKYETFAKDQEYFSQELNKLIDRVYQPVVVKYLLLVQSSGASQTVKPLPKSINAKKSKTPKWLQLACGKLLSERLTARSDGVLSVLRGILDIGEDDQVYA